MFVSHLTLFFLVSAYFMAIEFLRGVMILYHLYCLLILQISLVLTIRRNSQRKTKKFSRIWYFELCFYQTMFWCDLSKKSILQSKKHLQIIVNNYVILRVLEKSSRADRVNFSYILTL